MEKDFLNPVFDEAREQVKRAFEQMTSPELVSSRQSLYTCFKCGSKNIASVAKQVRSSDEGTSVFNTCKKCGNKWVE